MPNQPVPAAQLIADTRRRLGPSPGGVRADYTIIDLVSALNEAYQLWFDQAVRAADTSGRARADLRPFEVRERRLEDPAPVSPDSDLWASPLPADLYRRLNQWARVSCPTSTCPPKDIPVRIPGPDEIQEALRNPYRQADYAFEQLFGSEADHRFYLYPQKKLSIHGLWMDYYRSPDELHAPSLVACAEGEQPSYEYGGRTITRDTSLPVVGRGVERHIVALAATLLSGDRGDYARTNNLVQTIMAQYQLAAPAPSPN